MNVSEKTDRPVTSIVNASNAQKSNFDETIEKQNVDRIVSSNDNSISSKVHTSNAATTMATSTTISTGLCLLYLLLML